MSGILSTGSTRDIERPFSHNTQSSESLKFELTRRCQPWCGNAESEYSDSRYLFGGRSGTRTHSRFRRRLPNIQNTEFTTKSP